MFQLKSDYTSWAFSLALLMAACMPAEEGEEDLEENSQISTTCRSSSSKCINGECADNQWQYGVSFNGSSALIHVASRNGTSWGPYVANQTQAGLQRYKFIWEDGRWISVEFSGSNPMTVTWEHRGKDNRSGLWTVRATGSCRNYAVPNPGGTPPSNGTSFGSPSSNGTNGSTF